MALLPQALLGPLGGTLAGVTVSAADLNSDLHGSAEYRAALIPVLAARAVG